MTIIYEKNKIGKFIAWGSDHFVFAYDEDKVIKFSILSFLLGKHAEDKSLHDADISRKYLGEYVLKTELAFSLNGRHVAKIQPRVYGHGLRKQDLENPDIKRQVLEIFRAHQRMMDEGNAPLDLVGIKGVFRNSLTNIFVTDDGALRVIDATVLDFRLLHGMFKPFLHFISYIVVKRQNAFLKVTT